MEQTTVTARSLELSDRRRTGAKGCQRTAPNTASGARSPTGARDQQPARRDTKQFPNVVRARFLISNLSKITDRGLTCRDV